MNAKKEFISHIKDRTVKCAIVYFYDIWVDEDGEENQPHILLKIGWSDQDMEAFLTALDREYDNGYGGQILFGDIWYDDDTWSERGEYDGSEWWEYNRCPQIPDELQ